MVETVHMFRTMTATQLRAISTDAENPTKEDQPAAKIPASPKRERTVAEIEREIARRARTQRQSRPGGYRGGGRH